VLTVMIWNVENFFAPQPVDQAAYDAKLTELTDVIRAAAPDLLALQEVGDKQSFEALPNQLVVRLRIDLAEGFASSLDFVDDVFGGRFPDEGLGVGVPVVGPDRDCGGEVVDAGEDAAA
jgi:hypothetical protein